MCIRDRHHCVGHGLSSVRVLSHRQAAGSCMGCHSWLEREQHFTLSTEQVECAVSILRCLRLTTIRLSSRSRTRCTIRTEWFHQCTTVQCSRELVLYWRCTTCAALYWCGWCTTRSTRLRLQRRDTGCGWTVSYTHLTLPTSDLV